MRARYPLGDCSSCFSPGKIRQSITGTHHCDYNALARTLSTRASVMWRSNIERVPRAAAPRCPTACGWRYVGWRIWEEGKGGAAATSRWKQPDAMQLSPSPLQVGHTRPL